MGGERFDTPQPEAYLFGENGDLNFLGSRPTAVMPWTNPDLNDCKIQLSPFYSYDSSFHIRHHKRMNQRKRSRAWLISEKSLYVLLKYRMEPWKLAVIRIMNTPICSTLSSYLMPMQNVPFKFFTFALRKRLQRDWRTCDLICCCYCCHSFVFATSFDKI